MFRDSGCYARPSIPGIDRETAGVMPNEPIKLYRFEVKRYK